MAPVQPCYQFVGEEGTDCFAFYLFFTLFLYLFLFIYLFYFLFFFIFFSGGGEGGRGGGGGLGLFALPFLVNNREIYEVCKQTPVQLSRDCFKPNTVKPQWLEHFWDYGNLFETWVVRATKV